MMGQTVLERRLLTLIADYNELKKAHQEISRTTAAQEAQIRVLEEQCAGLRERIDSLDKDRFTIKQLTDERKLMRRKLATALTRLTALEEELAQCR